ncbi:MAG: class I SAM-dependent methyltransferase [Thermoguttaceae bacterium]|jgi:SAM-dependent methyltransferase|nr:class I SAM-dependent methyltransferase [Thermoguttaceae bacterium]
MQLIDGAKNVAFWNCVAQRSSPGYGAFAGMLMQGREFEALYRCQAEQEHFLRLFTPTKEARILEVGSGGGRWGFWLADRVGDYVGVDLSPGMVAIAEAERTQRRLSNVRFECVDLLDFNGRGQFDLVYFSGVLQYMDDAVVRQCIEKAGSLLPDGGVIISRDTVQKARRVEKTGEYPVIYRLASEYVALFAAAGYHLKYSDVSYPHKRFSGVAARFYQVPGVTYGMAYTLREVLCRIDNVLGRPSSLRSHKHGDNPQEHCFFKYARD